MKQEHKLGDICLDIEKCYEVKFLEIGTNEDHVHFLVQSVPMYSVKKLSDGKKLNSKGNISLLSRSEKGALGW